MSAPSAPTAETTAAAAAPKKSKKLLIIVIALLIVLGGGGGGFFFYTRANAATKEEEPEKSKKTKGKAKKAAADDEKEHEESEKEEKAGKDEEEEHDSEEDDSKVTQVIELQPFVVNLADQGEAHYLRLAVSVGVSASEGGEGGEEGKADPLFTTRVRNAMLAVLTTKTSDQVLSAAGKITLRKELLKATRKASEEPQVHAIYITDFIIQL